MEFEKILRLVETVSASELTGFMLEENGMRLSLEKRPGTGETTAPSMVPAGIGPAPALQTTVPVPVMQGEGLPAAPSGTDALLERPKVGGNGELSGEEIVKAPLVGTFYAAPSEDAEPFVKTGDAVKKGQVLGIIEAMKLMNEIESEYDGVVEAILISNEQVVEYGQPLFRIRRKG
ncbi:MAG: acetyl-CoA carboxylase biotin carboxyl carrier protein [Lachnospiraceae bacterium]|jgi:acetyl-CoA carboxylase biotin carboxyl carrier protein|nr:acetyl-CoA carboxylase biotin carboxyl carrier protein [Lachnospiraceae bacterium]